MSLRSQRAISKHHPNKENRLELDQEHRWVKTTRRRGCGLDETVGRGIG